VSSVSTSGFTLSTPTGGKVTIKETSSTRYEKGGTATSKSGVSQSATVLVLGTDDNTTIPATQVIVGPHKSNSTTASQVIAFNGTGDKSKTVGQIPASYKQGTGTILRGLPRTRPVVVLVSCTRDEYVEWRMVVLPPYAYVS
jgi:hypothetical protein